MVSLPGFHFPFLFLSWVLYIGAVDVCISVGIIVDEGIFSTKTIKT